MILVIIYLCFFDAEELSIFLTYFTVLFKTDAE